MKRFLTIEERDALPEMQRLRYRIWCRTQDPVEGAALWKELFPEEVKPKKPRVTDEVEYGDDNASSQSYDL